MFELLSNEDKSKMIKYINRYCGAEDEMQADLEYIMRFWDSNKQDLFHILGDKFILEKDIEIDANTAILSKEFREDSFLVNYIENWYTTFGSLANEHFCDSDSTNYRIFRELRDLLFDSYRALKNYADFRIYDFKEICVKAPNGKTLRLTNGMKLLRLVQKVGEAFEFEGTKEFIDKITVLKTKKKINGTLCLSIHPLDFMTLSDNASNWTSCMSWKESGCYRLGTVEMMNSDCVLVAYIKNKERDMDLVNGETWNNKMWRTLVVVDKGIITDIKHYPYTNTGVAAQVISILKPLVEDYWGVTYNNVSTSSSLYDEYGISFSTGAMYNDFERGQTNTFVLGDDVGDYDICYSGQPECMSCGQKLNIKELYDEADEEGQPFLACYSCRNPKHCPVCGERIYPNDNETTSIFGYTVHNDCLDKLPIDPFSNKQYVPGMERYVYVFEDESRANDRKDAIFTFRTIYNSLVTILSHYWYRNYDYDYCISLDKLKANGFYEAALQSKLD